MFKQSPKQAAVNHTRRNVRIGTDVTIDFGKYSAKYHIDGVVGKVVDILNIVNGTPMLYAVQYTNALGQLMTCDCPAWAISKWTRRIAD